MNQHPLPILKKFIMLSNPPVILPSTTICWWPRLLSPAILAWQPPPSLDYLSHTLPTYESIMEVMSLDEMLWKDHHHWYSFLPPCHMVEEHFYLAVSSDITMDPQSPILTRVVESEENLCNITKTMPMDISFKPRILENIYIGQNSSPSEVQSYTTLFK